MRFPHDAVSLSVSTCPDGPGGTRSSSLPELAKVDASVSVCCDVQVRVRFTL